MPPEDDKLIIRPEPEQKGPTVQITNCTACKFFQMIQAKPLSGGCHRIPPTPAMVGMRAHPLDPRQQEPVAMSFWPSVGPHDWCGEFVPATKRAGETQN